MRARGTKQRATGTIRRSKPCKAFRSQSLPVAPQACKGLARPSEALEGLARYSIQGLWQRLPRLRNVCQSLQGFIDCPSTWKTFAWCSDAFQGLSRSSKAIHGLQRLVPSLGSQCSQRPSTAFEDLSENVEGPSKTCLESWKDMLGPRMRRRRLGMLLQDCGRELPISFRFLAACVSTPRKGRSKLVWAIGAKFEELWLGLDQLHHRVRPSLRWGFNQVRDGVNPKIPDRVAFDQHCVGLL